MGTRRHDAATAGVVRASEPRACHPEGWSPRLGHVALAGGPGLLPSAPLQRRGWCPQRGSGASGQVTTMYPFYK